MENTSRTDAVLEVARMLDEHRGEDTIAIDLGEMNSWTDFFVITTVRSAAHLGGLMRGLETLLRDLGISPLRKHKRQEESGWVLLDCGGVAIHLMNSETREFFSLERLYFKGSIIYQSSKSS